MKPNGNDSELASRARPDLADWRTFTGERRSGRRFPLNLEVQYRLSAAARVGVGKTCNISSGGVFFTSSEILPPDADMELSLAWPALIDGVRQMKLVITGRTIRSSHDGTAIRTRSYEFRVLPLRRAIAAR